MAYSRQQRNGPSAKGLFSVILFFIFVAVSFLIYDYLPRVGFPDWWWWVIVIAIVWIIFIGIIIVALRE